MPHELIDRLVGDLPILTDGAWGTQLQALGLATGEGSDPWNLSHPEKVEAVARSYVEAGSRIILTNTFQASRFPLERQGLSDQVSEINRAGAEISKRAAGDKAFVFASMGPSGKMLTMGEIAEEELFSAFREQADALAKGGADGIVLETMGDLAEIKIALAAAKRTGLPVVACMCFDSGKNKDRTLMGVTPEQAAEELTDAGADVVGANCGQGIEGYIGICERLCQSTTLPVWIKANAGLPVIEDGKAVYQTTAEQFADSIPAVLEKGASFIGGCCGTSPNFIRVVSSRLSDDRRGPHQTH
ncbi:MAG: homocysteine S-methyltransferase family protein [Candidatus Omnitrophica bacterium]|nr:homocysteine S-methyltransferase family protein [Candidatus Omnitrophota bacterium]